MVACKLVDGGLVRAHTNGVERALLNLERIEVVKTRTLRCNTTRACENLVRRVIAKAGATILNVEHDTYVEIEFRLPETAASGLVAELNETGRGQVVWCDTRQPAH